MPTQPPLFGSLEKLKAAQRKFVEVEAAIKRFLANNPCRVWQKRESHITHYIAELQHDIPPELALAVGEVSVQARDALDKMMVSLVGNVNKRGTSGVSFPFGSIDEGKIISFPNTRSDRLKAKLTDDQWKLLVAQKPYPTGNDALWSINQIANCDKHWEGLVALRAKGGVKLAYKPLVWDGSGKGASLI